MNPDGPIDRVGHLIDLGRHELAVEESLKLLATDPENAELNRLHAIALLGSDHPVRAGQAARRAVRLDPDSAASHRLVSIIELQMGYPDRALPPAREALRLQPHEVANMLTLVEVLVEQPGTLQEARGLSWQAVELEPLEPACHVCLGLVWHTSQPGVAANAYREALRLDPSNVAAMNNLATLGGAFALPRKIRAFSGALAMDPSAAEPQENLRSALDLVVLLGYYVPILFVSLVLLRTPEPLVVGAVFALVWVGIGVAVVRWLPGGARALLPTALFSDQSDRYRALAVIAVAVLGLIAAVAIDSGRWSGMSDLLFAGSGLLLALGVLWLRSRMGDRSRG